MTESLADQVIRNIQYAKELYQQLILIVAPQGSGKTSVLKELQHRTGARIVNVNLELSRRMLDLTTSQRSLQLAKLLDEVVSDVEEDLILFDNIEILFDVSLQQDPLRLLQGISRNKTVVVSWCGAIEGDYMTYAEPGHPEYKRYPVSGLLIVSTEGVIK